MGTLIEIRDLAKTYERGKQNVEVLHHVNLDIAEGDFLALMGPSGSGKTTLLNLIGGLDAPSAGSISVGGQRIDQLGAGALARWRASNVGFIFKFYNLMPMLSAQRNVELPLLLTKLSAAQRRKNASIALQLVGLADRASHKPGELSGGQQQRVAIARALVTSPTLILADEPTANLDTPNGKLVMETMVRLNQGTGVTFVFATHDPRVIQYARRVVTLRDGLIVSDEVGETASAELQAA